MIVSCWFEDGLDGFDELDGEVGDVNEENSLCEVVGGGCSVVGCAGDKRVEFEVRVN
jgi:hypothetical protein